MKLNLGAGDTRIAGFEPPDDTRGYLGAVCSSMRESEMQRIARRKRVRRVLVVGELVGKLAGYALLAKVAGLPTALAFCLIIQAGELRAAREGL